MKNLGTPETHPEELVVFKNERQYYKICLLSDNSTTRSSSGWILAIPKIYISKKKYKLSSFNDCIGRPLIHSKSNDIFTMWKWIMPNFHASSDFIKLEIIKCILTWYRFTYTGIINEHPKRRLKVLKSCFFIT